MFFLATIFNPSIQKKLALGPAKVQKDPKIPKKLKIKKRLSCCNEFMKFRLNIAYIPFSK